MKRPCSVWVGTVSAGIKTPGHKDLVLIEVAPGTHCAAVFTQNAFCAAPVLLAKAHLQKCDAEARFLLINTGNANAGTGQAGIDAAVACSEAVAELAGIGPGAVLPFSTGVIGEPLPVDNICRALPLAFEALDTDGWLAAGWGILTTDTRPKGASVRFSCGGGDYVITGIAKGAGMIRPNMATMLAYLATDMAVDKPVLQGLLAEAAEDFVLDESRTERLAMDV